MYVYIKLILQNDNYYLYQFQSREQTGLLAYNAANQEVTLVQAMQGSNAMQHYFRARAAILREVSKGHIPQETCFASG